MFFTQVRHTKRIDALKTTLYQPKNNGFQVIEPTSIGTNTATASICKYILYIERQGE